MGRRVGAGRGRRWKLLLDPGVSTGFTAFLDLDVFRPAPEIPEDRIGAYVEALTPLYRLAIEDGIAPAPDRGVLVAQTPMQRAHCLALLEALGRKDDTPLILIWGQPLG